MPGCYDDLDAADLVVLVGSNMAWCHPVLYQRLAAAKEARGTKIVVIDPRRTATCEIADLHLALRPGSDVAVFAGLLLHLPRAAHTMTWIADYTAGFAAAIDAAPALSKQRRSPMLPIADLAWLYGWFAATERTVTLYSQGVNQSRSRNRQGQCDHQLVISPPAASAGRGMGPFSVQRGSRTRWADGRSADWPISLLPTYALRWPPDVDWSAGPGGGFNARKNRD